MIEMTLSPPRYWQPFSWATTKVRITNDARQCVVFLGDCDPSGDPKSFAPYATAFLLGPKDYSGCIYLVTARHCAHEGIPFWVRINRETDSELLLIETPEWVFHDDPTVDVAVMEFPDTASVRNSRSQRAWYGRRYDEKWNSHNFGPGDLVHTVGLFRYHTGTTRNIPIVHSGHIAAFSKDERIRVRDWSKPDIEQHIAIDAYIVQCAAFRGASGSPVFVRETRAAVGEFDHGHYVNKRSDGRMATSSLEREHSARAKDPTAYGDLYLLGLWHGSWEVDSVTLTRGEVVRDPAGYGIVVPAKYIFEVLDMPKLKDPREKVLQEQKKERAKNLPVADSLPRREAQQKFDGTLKRMLDTPPDPKTSKKTSD